MVVCCCCCGLPFVLFFGVCCLCVVGCGLVGLWVVVDCCRFVAVDILLAVVVCCGLLMNGCCY